MMDPSLAPKHITVVNEFTLNKRRRTPSRRTHTASNILPSVPLMLLTYGDVFFLDENMLSIPAPARHHGQSKNSLDVDIRAAVLDLPAGQTLSCVRLL